MATPKSAPPAPSINSAKEILIDFLKQMGLESLGEWAWKTFTEAGGGDLGMSLVGIEIYKTPEFKARFPAYEAMAKKGQALSPKQMLDYEEQTRQIMHAAGLPSGFYDKPDDFAKFMLNDVSPTELQNRVQIAQTAAITAPEEVRTQLQRLYGVNHGELTAYFLDPTQAMPVIQQRFTASQIAAQSQTTGFGQLEQTQAEKLAAEGVTEQAAQEGFGALSANAGLFEQQVAGEDVIDPNAQIAAQFEQNAAARKRIEQRKQSRLGEFQGQSGFGVGQKGVTGLGSTQQ